MLDKDEQSNVTGLYTRRVKLSKRFNNTELDLLSGIRCDIPVGQQFSAFLQCMPRNSSHIFFTISDRRQQLESH